MRLFDLNFTHLKKTLSNNNSNLSFIKKATNTVTTM